jgi:4-aminobutyrate aminotransferase-like enzyme
MKSVPSRVAAFIVQPILGEGGYQPAAPGFLTALRKICDRHRILLICGFCGPSYEVIRLSPPLIIDRSAVTILDAFASALDETAA